MKKILPIILVVFMATVAFAWLVTDSPEGYKGM